MRRHNPFPTMFRDELNEPFNLFINPLCLSSPLHCVALWCSCDVSPSLSSPSFDEDWKQWTDTEKLPVLYTGVMCWNIHRYMTQLPCEEIIWYQRKINCSFLMPVQHMFINKSKRSLALSLCLTSFIESVYSQIVASDKTHSLTKRLMYFSI